MTDIDDVIAEVRRLDGTVPDDDEAFEHLVQCLTVCRKAAPLLAAEVERLRAENARLREALAEAARGLEQADAWCGGFAGYVRAARAALAKGGDP